MGPKLTILFCFALTALSAQGIDKEFVNNWIKSCDNQISIDSVEAYYVDGQLHYGYHVQKLNDRLSEISTDNVAGIWYSPIKKDNYVPGRGTIYVETVSQKKVKVINGWLDKAKTLFNDKYISFSQHILTDSKDPVLVIDGNPIDHALAKETIERMNAKDIYDIYVNEFFPVPPTIYGQNAINGIVQIWTKEIKKQR